MGLFDFLTPKKKAVPFPEAQTEEYKLPKLERGNFCMTEELLQRKRNEELKKQFGIHLEKDGKFI